jgi:hypothetical protein
MRRPSRWRRRCSLPALSRRPLHCRIRFMRPETPVWIRQSACPLYLPCCGGRVRCACSRVSGEGLPERLLLCRCLFDRLRAVLPRYASVAIRRHRACIATPWLEVFGEELDKVRREQADHAPIALQTSHPPGAVASVEAFDQVSFYEAEVALCLKSGQSGGYSSRWGLRSRLTSPPHE